MKRSQLDLRRLEKVLALLDSAVEGEAHAALGRAKHMLAGADVSFSQLTVGISGSQGFDQERSMGTAQDQELEQELESLRWSLACHELEIATLHQSVEDKTDEIQREQAKSNAREEELVELRKVHAVQKEEVLNRRDEAEEKFDQIEKEQAIRHAQEGELTRLRKAHALQKGEAQRGRAVAKEKSSQIKKEQTIRKALEEELISLSKAHSLLEDEAQRDREVLKENSAQILREQILRHAQEEELIGLRKAHALKVKEARSSKTELTKKRTEIKWAEIETEAQVKELVNFRKAHAVEKEEALRHKAEVKNLSRQVKAYIASAKVKGVGPDHYIRSQVEYSNAKKSVDRSTPKPSYRKFMTMEENPPYVRSSSSKFEGGIFVNQGSLDLVGGEDTSVGKEYRWARLEEKHQVIAEVHEAGNDVAGAVSPLVEGKGLRAKA